MYDSARIFKTIVSYAPTVPRIGNRLSPTKLLNYWPGIALDGCQMPAFTRSMSTAGVESLAEMLLMSLINLACVGTNL